MEAILLVVVVVGVVVFFGIVYSIIMSFEEDEYTPPRSQPKPPTTPRTPPRPLFEWEKREQEEYKIRTFWKKAYKYAIQYVEENDLDALNEFMANIWNTRDLKESAKDLHALTETVIEYLYPSRNVSQYHTDTIINLCYLILSNVNNYKLKAGVNTVWRSPTKLAILLEKLNRIDEAIELCEFCYKKKIPDHGYNNFAERKKHLENKKIK